MPFFITLVTMGQAGMLTSIGAAFVAVASRFGPSGMVYAVAGLGIYVSLGLCLSLSRHLVRMTPDIRRGLGGMADLATARHHGTQSIPAAVAVAFPLDSSDTSNLPVAMAVPV